MQRIPTLDGWRGVAISMVLVDHGLRTIGSDVAWPPWLISIGQHGVGIFFVLSGYLITSRLMEQQRVGGRVSLGDFYRRRFFKLMPVAWCFLAVAGLITYIQHRGGWPAMVGALLFFRNYVDRGGTHALTGHFWSLSIEEQFYLVWPLLFARVRRELARSFLFASAAFCAAYRWYAVSHDGALALFQTQYRIDAIVVGCLLAFLLPTMIPYLRTWMAPLLVVGLAVCIRMNPLFVPLYESIAIAVLIAVTSIHTETFLSRVLEAAPLKVLGLVSYSLYVWQQVVFLWMGGQLHRVPVGLAVLAGLTFFSYVLIERPFTRLGHRREAGSDSAKREALAGQDREVERAGARPHDGMQISPGG